MSKAENKDLEDLTVLVKKAVEPLLMDSEDEECLNRALRCLSQLYEVNEELCTGNDIVVRLLELLNHPNKAIKVAALHCVCKVSAFDNLKFKELLDIIPNLNKLFLMSSMKVKSLVLSIVYNLVIEYDTALAEILDNSSFLYKMFTDLSTPNKKLKSEILQTLGIFVKHSRMDQLRNMVEEGLLSYVIDKIGTGIESFQVLEDYMALVYSVLIKERDQGPDENDLEFLDEFEDNGGFDK